MERNDIDIRLLDYWLVYENGSKKGMKTIDTAQQLTRGFSQQRPQRKPSSRLNSRSKAKILRRRMQYAKY
jgi:hypothetical protein